MIANSASVTSRLNGGPCQSITALVLIMTIVAAHPAPLNFVWFGQFQQALPEIPVGNRLLLLIFPAAFDPAINPLGHALFYIL